MADKTEVKAKLTLDDAASAVLDKIKGGFATVSGAADSTQAKFLDFAKQTAAIAIGTNIGSVFDRGKAALVGAFEAAKQNDQQMRELAKTVAGMSTVNGRVEDLGKATNMTTKETWELKRAAKGATTDFMTGATTVYDRLSDIAREAQVARGSLVEAFADAGKNTTRTNDQLVNLIAQVAKASRALPAPVKDVVAGFMEIEKNMISAGNPLIEMVKQANLFRGHNEQIALKLQGMGRQGMLNIMNKALKEMQERAKKMPLTLAEMGEQLADMKSDVLKLVGGPMVGALTPAFRQLQKFIADNRGQIEAYARTLGQKVGQWVTEAAGLIKEGFAYVQAHADEIKKALREGFDYAKAVFSWMLEHRGGLAAGFVAMKGASLAGGAAAGIAGTVGGVVDFGKSLAAANASGIGPLAAGSAGAAASLGAFGAAAGAVAATVWQFGEYLKETGGYLSASKGEKAKDFDAQMKAFKSMAGNFEDWDQGSRQRYAELKQRTLENAAALDMNTEAVSRQIDAEYERHQALAEAASGMVKARDAVDKFKGVDLGKFTEEQMDQFYAAQANAGQAFTESFNKAVQTNNAAALGAAVEIIKGSKTLQASLLETGTSVGLSLEKLAEVIGDKAGDFGDKLRERAEQDKATSGTKPPPAVMQFNGGQTFNIKQDFRDQDPDRVAVTFMRDVKQAAENRLQSRSALPFGGLPCVGRLRRVSLPPWPSWLSAPPTSCPPNCPRTPMWWWWTPPPWTLSCSSSWSPPPAGCSKTRTARRWAARAPCKTGPARRRRSTAWAATGTRRKTPRSARPAWATSKKKTPRSARAGKGSRTRRSRASARCLRPAASAAGAGGGRPRSSRCRSAARAPPSPRSASGPPPSAAPAGAEGRKLEGRGGRPVTRK